MMHMHTKQSACNDAHLNFKRTSQQNTQKENTPRFRLHEQNNNNNKNKRLKAITKWTEFLSFAAFR